VQLVLTLEGCGMTIDLLKNQRLSVLLPDGSELVLEHHKSKLSIEYKVEGRLDTLVRIPLDDQHPPA